MSPEPPYKPSWPICSAPLVGFQLNTESPTYCALTINAARPAHVRNAEIESREKDGWEICLVQIVSPDGPLNGTFTVIPTRRKQSGGHPAIRLLCSQAPPPRHGALCGLCGAIWAFFAPGVQSLGPLRGNLGRFCPWGRFQKSQRHTAQRTTLPLKRIPRKRIVTIGRGDYSKVSIFMSDTVISNTVPKHK